MNILNHELDVVGWHPGLVARQELPGLRRICQECSVVTGCGGGLYTHRYPPLEGTCVPDFWPARQQVNVGATGPEARQRFVRRPAQSWRGRPTISDILNELISRPAKRMRSGSRIARPNRGKHAYCW
jgi:hypothetical protein